MRFFANRSDVVAALVAVGAPILLWLTTVYAPFSWGDGPEYYALFFAWTETLRPWMTDQAWGAYSTYQETGIPNLYPAEFLSELFPGLRVGDTADFNHFWMYSFAASVVSLGVLGPYESFILLHALAMCMTITIGYRSAGWPGISAVLLLTIASPVAWYYQGVHPEFVTHCLLLSAFILALSNRLEYSALLTAFAATQNPGFSIVSVMLLGFQFLASKKSYSGKETLAVVLSVAVLALHPTYYFFRYGVITPQMFAGGADVGSNLSYWYIWLIDPDIGLLPNWILGLVVGTLGAAAIFTRSVKWPNGWGGALFALALLTVGLFTASSTQNLNSGALPGPARYSLWFICLLYPITVAFIRAVYHSRTLLLASTAVVVIYSAINYPSNAAYTLGDYVVPTALSRFIQTNFSWAYSPPPEVFLERYSGRGEIDDTFLAVVGPDCRKILILPRNETRTAVSMPHNCTHPTALLTLWVDEMAAKTTEPIFASIP